jgi:signal transduction histidine kinase
VPKLPPAPETAPPELPHFDIDATVVKRLGDELISDEVSAIMELVKNSYDADADWVKIIISTEGIVPKGMVYAGSKSYITLEDNGDGMTYDDIVKKWLVISLSSKRDMKANNETTKKGRVPLGDKGVGRLSTQRLGQQLEMISGILGSEESNHLAFDWSDFESHVPLTKVRLKHLVTPKKAKQKGTKLVITKLTNADIWKKEAADRFRGQLSQLIFPYKKKRPFAVYLTINGLSQDLDEITEDLQTQAVGHYDFNFTGDKLIIDGKIRLGKLRGQAGTESKEEFDKYLLVDQGQNFLNFLTDKITNRDWFLTDIDSEENWFFSFHRELAFDKDFPGKKANPLSLTDLTEKATIANPGPFSGEIDDYDLRGTESTDDIFKGLKRFKSLVNNQIGIRVFRDGFGIKPYGFDGQDWLSLGSGQTSGASFYGLRPNNVIGFVSISMAKNAQLKELTSREGFTESPHSRNFMTIMQRVVREINFILERTRRSYADYKKHTAEKVTGFQSISQPVALLKQASRQAEAVNTRSRQAERNFSNLSKTLKTQVSRLQNEPLFAAPGETKTLPLLKEAEEMVSEGARLFTEINKILDEAKKWEETAAYVSTKVTNLEGQIVQFTELAGLGLTAEALTHDVYVLLEKINNYTDEFNQQLGRASVPATVYEFIAYVRSFSRDLHRQLNHLAPSLRFNREKRETVSVTELVEQSTGYYKSRFSKAGIDFKIDTKQDFRITANLGKLTQVFDNLFLNAEYWLKERKRAEEDFSAEIRIEISEPTIKVSDNGYGVTNHVESTLFQPFITAKPTEIGRGLGLFIVQQLLESMGCDILLLQKRNKLNRRYIFQLNMESAIRS